MTLEDYEAMNNILIAQAGEMEILLQGKDEEIRELKAEIKRLRSMLPPPVDPEHPSLNLAIQEGYEPEEET